MYDELKKRLREPCQYENCVLCQQAADAIEELSKRVPPVPHGRLIDLEQAVIILERLRDHCGNGDMAYALNWAANTIRDLPTIIPASFENPTKNARYSQDNPAEEGE